jgi:hypothetical protein
MKKIDKQILNINKNILHCQKSGNIIGLEYWRGLLNNIVKSKLK